MHTYPRVANASQCDLPSPASGRSLIRPPPGLRPGGCGVQYFGANGKGLMLPRLALLVAAALIFAPYQSGEETSKPPRGADLAARVLAPTFDEGAIRGATQDFNHLLTSRHTTRLSAEPSLVRPAGAFRVGIALSLIWLLSLEQIRALHRFLHSSRLSRGPPLLQLA
jgi:hypothetical protein